MDRLSLLIVGDKISPQGARLEHAFFTVDKEGPGIIGIGREPPTAVLPVAVEGVVFKDGALGIRDVRFAFLLNEDSATGGNALGPAETEHPAHRIKHMDAHIAHDAVAIFHKGPPPALVRQAVVWPQGRRAGPHLIIEEIRNWLHGWIAVGTHVEITTHIHMTDLAEEPAFDDLFFGVDQVRRAFALRADLDNPVVLARGGQDRLPFQDIDTDRLL